MRTPARRRRVLTRAFAVRVVQVQSAFVLWVVLVASILRSVDCGGEAVMCGVACRPQTSPHTRCGLQRAVTRC